MNRILEDLLIKSNREYVFLLISGGHLRSWMSTDSRSFAVRNASSSEEDQENEGGSGLVPSLKFNILLKFLINCSLVIWKVGFITKKVNRAIRNTSIRAHRCWILKLAKFQTVEMRNENLIHITLTIGQRIFLLLDLFRQFRRAFHRTENMWISPSLWHPAYAFRTGGKKICWLQRFYVAKILAWQEFLIFIWVYTG